MQRHFLSPLLDALSGRKDESKPPTAVTIAVPNHTVLDEVIKHIGDDWNPHYSGIDQDRANSQTRDGLIEFTFYPDEPVDHDQIIAWFGPDARIESVAPYEMEED